MNLAGRLLLTGCVLATLAGCSRVADDHVSQFAEANRLYEAKDFAGAASAYEALLASGVESGVAHYNLANTWLQLGETGKALVEYERAWRLLPRHEDIKRNRELVTDLVKFRDQPTVTHSATARLLEGIYRLMNLREWQMLFFAAVLGLLALTEGLLLAPFLVRRNPWAWAALALAVLLPAVPLVHLLQRLQGSWGLWGTVALSSAGCLSLAALALVQRLRGTGGGLARAAFSVIVLIVVASGVAFGAKYRDYRVLDQGLALTPDVAVYRAPDPDSDIIRRIPQGTPLRLLRSKGDWREVLLPDRAKGWVESDAAGEI